jgi:hypothetical protein
VRDAVKCFTASWAELRHPACCLRPRGRRYEDDELYPEGTPTCNAALPRIGCPALHHRGHQYHGNHLIVACCASRMTMPSSVRWHSDSERRYGPHHSIQRQRETIGIPLSLDIVFQVGRPATWGPPAAPISQALITQAVNGLRRAVPSPYFSSTAAPHGTLRPMDRSP